MTGAATVSKLACRVLDVRILVLFVWSRFVVACVTTRAIRLERTELPDDQLRIRLVAFRACQVATVILRLIRQGRVLEVGR